MAKKSGEAASVIAIGEATRELERAGGEEDAEAKKAAAMAAWGWVAVAALAMIKEDAERPGSRR